MLPLYPIMRNDMKRTLCVLLSLLLLTGLQTMGQTKHGGKNSSSQIDDINPDPVAMHAVPDRPGSSVIKPRLPGSIYSTRYDGPTIHGIDVSHHNHTIDWSKVAREKDAGFVYIKATEGRDFIDNQYMTNLRGARRHGLKVGSYHFFRANVSAEQQLELIKRIIPMNEQDLVLMIDVEQTNGVGIYALQARLIELARLVENYIGCPPLIYTGRHFYNKHFAGYAQFKRYPFWIAQYSNIEPALDYGDDYLIWQYTSKGSISGIRGNVDKNCFMNGHSLNEIIYRRRR